MPERRTFEAIVKDEAVHWIARLNSGNCSEREREDFREWLGRSEAHRREFQHAQDYWDSLAAHRASGFPELAEARRYAGSQRRAFNLAAAAVLLIAVAVFWAWPTQDDVAALVFQTAKGEQKEVTLADGTRVELNTGTRIRVEYTGKIRRVLLEQGEAFFTVGPSDDRPFEVAAGNGRIRDIGTRFNVYSQDDGLVSVAVVEGAVVILTDRSAHPFLVAAGHQASYGAAGQVLGRKMAETDASALTAWRSKRIVFKDATISELAEQITRYHDVGIVIDDPGVKRMRVSGNFRTDDLDGLLGALEVMLPVKAKQLPDGIVKLSLTPPLDPRSN